MKLNTDIKQSQKLAEFLPIESADMCYIQDLLAGGKYGDYKPYIGDLIPAYGQGKIRCWSLAALLDFLAQQDCFPEITYTGTCYLMDINFYDNEEGKTIHPIHFIRTEGNTLIDACVEMICKLKEIGLL